MTLLKTAPTVAALRSSQVLALKGDDMIISYETLVQSAANAIDSVWEAEWRRNDFFFYLTQALSKDEIKRVMNQIGRSHEDAFRWAEKSAAFPPDQRMLDRSPREHTRQMNAAKGGKSAPRKPRSKQPAS